MKFYIEILKLIFNKYIRKYKNGKAIKIFCENMGLVYIKLAQILSTQNYGNLFSEEDRKILSSICDNCNIVPFNDIKKIIENEYGDSIDNLFEWIDEKPLGSASISQVHKAKLKDGNIVAIKVRRLDITKNIEKEIKRIKSLMYNFGKYIKFGNYIGGNKALDLYLSWIYEETDFLKEVNNIKTYTEFANSVNNKIEGNKQIKVPKLYEELCTDNIIIMEYIKYKTINKMSLNNENNEKIKIALNSYISSSLYALFNDLKIIFHGDPHGGNIYIDDNGDIGFLDMGLIFELSSEDIKLTKDFFFAAYTRNYEKMFNLVIPYGVMDYNTKLRFKNEIKEYCDNLALKPITSYFIDMMNICLKYEICPPNFLFCMSKAFICLGGISNFTNNDLPGTELLKEQVLEYYIKRTINDSKYIIYNGIKLFPKVIANTFKYGLIKGLSKELTTSELLSDSKIAIEHYKELIEIFYSSV